MFYLMRNVLRLRPKRNGLPCFNHTATTNGGRIATDENKKLAKKDFQQLYQRYKDKIMFNSYLDYEKIKASHMQYHIKLINQAKEAQAASLAEKTLPPLPVALRYYLDKDRLLPEKGEDIIEPNQAFQLPFAKTTPVAVEGVRGTDEPDENVAKENHKLKEKEHGSTDIDESEFDRCKIRRWMENYEHFDDTKLTEDFDEDETNFNWAKQYGTPNPDAGISRVPCGGCGALLHCSEPSIPGYLPSEIYIGRTKEELQTTECQRCHFLKEYNIALDITVESSEYEQVLQSIRHVKSLVLLMVDLLDFPCSLWPGIVDIIGKNRPLFIVANKVDLLPGDSENYLTRIKESLMAEINKTKLGEANIKHLALISAKTGYGVENLITNMFYKWLYRGDVFLVGTTNVGKSSLFNALLQSDYCKVHAVDIVKRATVSRWPGTTLNLLKFPINRPSGWKLQERLNRLKRDAKISKAERAIRHSQLGGNKVTALPSLVGHIGRTFSEYEVHADNIAEKRTQLTTLNEKHELFAKSKWLYDTPGVILADQVLSLFSTEELLLTVPKAVLRPQTYYLREGSTLFVAGAGRVDVVSCADPCRLTVYASERLPITVTRTEDADEVYETFLGTELFAVPTGGAERLDNWPGLKRKEDLLEFIGEGPKACCGDVVLTSIAWVSVTAKKDATCKLAAWSPEGRGIHRRLPSLLPYGVNMKGKRVRHTPAYRLGKIYTQDDV